MCPRLHVRAGVEPSGLLGWLFAHLGPLGQPRGRPRANVGMRQSDQLSSEPASWTGVPRETQPPGFLSTPRSPRAARAPQPLGVPGARALGCSAGCRDRAATVP